ncbi:hypothetical protein ACIQWZ_35625 [Streptomyces sp. NPDC098077]|uniref:hypothetical protein n=1 Tax=Streptomyces sp. NPDC098077 TaxID=3366093 RepID=UPI0038244829
MLDAVRAVKEALSAERLIQPRLCGQREALRLLDEAVALLTDTIQERAVVAEENPDALPRAASTFGRVHSGTPQNEVSAGRRS